MPLLHDDFQKQSDEEQSLADILRDHKNCPYILIGSGTLSNNSYQEDDHQK